MICMHTNIQIHTSWPNSLEYPVLDISPTSSVDFILIMSLGCLQTMRKGHCYLKVRKECWVRLLFSFRKVWGWFTREWLEDSPSCWIEISQKHRLWEQITFLKAWILRLVKRMQLSKNKCFLVLLSMSEFST